MNYKKVFRSKELRLKLLRFLSFVPDEWMIKFQYFIKTGRLLKLKTPVRYTEKVQWYKLFYRIPLVSTCSDKVAVRDFVQERGLGNILTCCYAVHESVDAICFDDLPSSFAIKYNNGSGVNFFIEDKDKVDERQLKNIIANAVANSYVESGREWGYKDIPAKFFIEQLLPRDRNNDIPDYKFFCFSGRVEYLYVMRNYVDDHSKGECSFFTPEFEKLPYRRSEYKPIIGDIDKPDGFDEMIRVAEILSAGFPHVRVDLYNIEGRIYFGELTFYPASGYTKFEPDEFDFIMGEKFVLPEICTD